MTIKKTKEFARFEWKKNRGNKIGDIFEGKYGGVIRDKCVIGEYDVSSLVGKQNTKDQILGIFNNVYRRLVPCSVYGKLYGFMRGKPAYSGSRIYDMALNKGFNRVRDTGEKENLNYFIIGGIMFILMTQEEYYVDLKHDFRESKKYNESGFRKYLMSHPKTKEANERLEDARKEAVKQWKSGREDNQFGFDMAYHGDEWDYFFTEVFPTWENKTAADSVGAWAAQAGYYAFSDSDRGAVKKIRCGVGDLWGEYMEFCQETRYIPLYVKQFSIRMAELGFLKRSGAAGRGFDVFIGEADAGEWEQKQAERVAAERERMRERMGAMRVKRDDSEFLLGLSGRWQAAQLWSRYEEWCRDGWQQLNYGKRGFYKFLDDNGFSRETKSGTLYMEKK